MVNLRLIYDQLNLHKKAQQCYLQSLTIKPNDQQSLNNYGLSLALNNQLQLAIDQLTAANTLTNSKISLANIKLIKKTYNKYKHPSTRLQNKLFKHKTKLSQKTNSLLNKSWQKFCSPSFK